MSRFKDIAGKGNGHTNRLAKRRESSFTSLCTSFNSKMQSPRVN